MEPVFLAGLVFLGMKGFAAVVGAIAVSAILNLMTNDLTWTIAGVFGGIVLGFMAPDFYLTSKAGSRGGGIRDQLPDALDRRLHLPVAVHRHPRARRPLRDVLLLGHVRDAGSAARP